MGGKCALRDSQFALSPLARPIDPKNVGFSYFHGTADFGKVKQVQVPALTRSLSDNLFEPYRPKKPSS